MFVNWGMTYGALYQPIWDLVCKHLSLVEPELQAFFGGETPEIIMSVISNSASWPRGHSILSGLKRIISNSRSDENQDLRTMERSLELTHEH